MNKTSKIGKVMSCIALAVILIFSVFSDVTDIIDVNTKSFKAVFTAASVLVILAGIVFLIQNLKQTDKDPGCEKGGKLYKIRFSCKIANSLIYILLILAYLMNVYKHETVYIALLIAALVSALATFVLWYIYRAQVSKMDNDGIII